MNQKRTQFTEQILNKIDSNILKFGSRNAFCIAEKFYTYKDLDEKINAFSAKINDLQIAQGIIGLVVNDDIETYASILAIWKANKAYVPLHPKQPTERNLEILSQTGSNFYIDSENSNFGEKLININSAISKPTGLVINNIDSPDDLCYILFTSGSTGQPKGVQINCENLVTFVNSFELAGIKLNENDKCLQAFDLTFDVSVQAFLIPLLSGACVYTIPHDKIKYTYAYILMDDHQLTFGVFAPSLVKLLRPNFEEINIPSMRYCILTAEASPVDLVKEWHNCIPNSKIFNFYGPTEATIYCTSYEVPLDGSEIKHTNGLLCIGRPFEGLNYLIVNEENNSVDKNVKGNLLISGPQLTIGYWNNKEKTSEVFIEINGTNYYKTGDVVFEDNDHQIHYLGRADQQVKIQGYRIELGEIEYHARQLIDGKYAIACAVKGKNDDNEIVLCLESDPIDNDAINKHLSVILPSYMIPSKYYFHDIFPLNQNGKVDRNAVKKLFNL